MAKKQDQESGTLMCVMHGCTRAAEIKYTQMCNRCHVWQRAWTNRNKKDRYARFCQIKFWQERASGWWRFKP